MDRSPLACRAVPWTDADAAPLRVALRRGGCATIRSLGLGDAPLQQAFANTLSADSRRNRWHPAVDGPGASTPRPGTSDAQRHVVLAATLVMHGHECMIGEARYAVAADGHSGEFALAVADDWQGQGLASRLLEALSEAARSAGLRRLMGSVRATDARMLGCVLLAGFTITPSAAPAAGLLRVQRDLDRHPVAPRLVLPRPLRRARQWVRERFGNEARRHQVQHTLAAR